MIHWIGHELLFDPRNCCTRSFMRHNLIYLNRDALLNYDCNYPIAPPTPYHLNKPHTVGHDI